MKLPRSTFLAGLLIIAVPIHSLDGTRSGAGTCLSSATVNVGADVALPFSADPIIATRGPSDVWSTIDRGAGRTPARQASLAGNSERMRRTPELGPEKLPPPLSDPPMELGSGAWVRTKIGETIAYNANVLDESGDVVGMIHFDYYLWSGNSTANLPPDDIGGAVCVGGFQLTKPCPLPPGWIWGWVQTISASDPGTQIWGAGADEWFVDSSDRADPDYPYTWPGYTEGFQDWPHRPLAAPADIWNAELALVCKNLTEKKMIVMGSLRWGFEINAAGVVQQGGSYGSPWLWGNASNTFIQTVTKDWPGQDDYSDWTVQNGSCCPCSRTGNIVWVRIDDHSAIVPTAVAPISVYGGLSGGGNFETIQGIPDWQGWTSIDMTVGVGDFAHVWPILDGIDPCGENRSPRVAFIDDGEVVPGTGGYLGASWIYGPMGYIVNPEGGLAGPDYYLKNEIWSPEIEWPNPERAGAILSFDAYVHEPLWAEESPGMFATWHVRSTADPTGLDGWTDWRDQGVVYYGGPGNVRVDVDVSDLLLPDRSLVQIALGVEELGWFWGYEGTDGTPGPYFDNVELKSYAASGPAISFNPATIECPQDAFPPDGVLNLDSPCDNSVRFDMARDITYPGLPGVQPGDSIVFSVAAVRAGSELADVPELCYRLKPNHLFDACRTALPPGPGNSSYSGCTPGDTVRTVSCQAIPGRFAFDLPDTGFFFPGDIIHYYIRATDTFGGSTTLPADTNGFSIFPGDPAYVSVRYPQEFVVRALPSIDDLSTYHHPEILLWDDAGLPGVENEWTSALLQLGYREGVDLDVYRTRGPSAGASNGLGSRATTSLLAGYSAILYSAGDMSNYTISGMNVMNDKSNDVGLLDGWLRQGDKCLLLTGDNIVSDMLRSGPATAAFVNTWLQVNLVDYEHRNQLGEWSPTIQAFPMSGNPLLTQAMRWTALGYCSPLVRTFDVLQSLGAPGKVADWLSNCASGVLPPAAAIYNTSSLPVPSDQVVLLPFDLGYVIEDTDCGGNPLSSTLPVRVLLLQDILYRFTYLPGGYPVGVPETGVFALRTHPNPFNPNIVIDYQVPVRGELTIRVYNLRGELVRTLLAGPVPAGPGRVIWDGTDQGRAAVSSGAYFCVAEIAGQSRSDKILLLR
jgi:hypothetical protein